MKEITLKINGLIIDVSYEGFERLGIAGLKPRIRETGEELKIRAKVYTTPTMNFLAFTILDSKENKRGEVVIPYKNEEELTRRWMEIYDTISQ